ncbi:ERV/ALR sulfhydryl oxidase domain-containing protein [Collybia nuda]|uniref:Sulfhydryl oxidase n=1 Tax=Collybia nuda TaxID=64659 RepID=A0A9P6CIR6_9AGAR|nr:ERV/ALR sulfhydryl oxidase domain-containing protein [Collybia nuda]
MISRFAKSFFAVIILLFVIAMLALVHPPSRTYMEPWSGQLLSGSPKENSTLHPGTKIVETPPIGGVKGGVIMSKLGNETAKAALGRATWKLMHTMTLRFPENPTPDERTALSSYFHLTSRLYPCGECAEEFQMLLKKFPPQTSSRRSAALWLCSVHNEVNKRLKKPEFDCAHLDDEYDCGCDDSPVEGSPPSKVDPMDLEYDPSRDDITGADLIKGGR